MAIFGASLMPAAAFTGAQGFMAQRRPEPQYTRRKRTLAENIGMLADAFHGDNRHGQMLMAQDQQDYQRWADMQRQAQEFANWQRRFDYQASHQPPPEPTSFERDLLAAGIDPKSPRGRALYQQKVTNAATAPPIVQRNSDGTYSVYPMGAIPRGGATPQSLGATLPQGWTVGGPTPRASGTFP